MFYYIVLLVLPSFNSEVFPNKPASGCNQDSWSSESFVDALAPQTIPQTFAMNRIGTRIDSCVSFEVKRLEMARDG